MLVLTRRANQSIRIGDDIVITVVEMRGDQVRLGIEAPRSVAIHRTEVLAQVERENAEAAQTAPADLAAALRLFPPSNAAPAG